MDKLNKKNKKILILIFVLGILLISTPFALKEIRILNAKIFFWQRNDDFNNIIKICSTFKKISSISKNRDSTFNVLFLKYEIIDSNRTIGNHLSDPILNINADSLNKLIYSIEYFDNSLTLLKLNNYVSSISITPYYINIKTNEISWQYAYKKSAKPFVTNRIKIDDSWELEPLYKRGKFEY